MLKHLFATCLIICLGFASSMALAKPIDDGAKVQPDNYYPRVKLETSMGDIIVELDRRRAPITVNNFLRYTANGLYNNTIFHRVVPGFVVQGGGYSPELEQKVTYDPIFNESGNGLTNDLHTISMARQNEPHSATRQFFLNVNDNESLNPGRNWGYAVFGMIVEGSAIADKMAEVETEYLVALGEQNAPKEMIILKKASVLPPQ
ncbi:peptidylprolyl isomerase [Alteromonas ponticola]|uniref:Peptidyl-prolyl cis-trans isomerase n=1 Tax=Alteromonas ponticola TaxID=2720613 RepID=A0ABX1R1P5_9ALTE|nr:peptidylprolyl isomerase [Alteromonas ponticola]NMH60377.1 peptidyl-prolyl cis-trans isomerase [Alteromonas ponticola]